MDKGISAATAWRLADTLRGKAEAEVPQTGTATFVRTDADGTAWIRIPGNDFDTPVEGGVTASASAGDTVSYSIGGGRVSVTGNVSAPATSAAHVDEVVEPVSEMAQSAVRDAGLAAAAAESAQQSADAASAAASSAQADATRASTAATDALTQLSTVQDVVGTVEWAAAHSGEDMASYISSHLALTDAGLWLTLDGSGYKLLLSSDGATVYDPAGHAVSTFGESITLDSSRPQSIGGEDAYIVFYDSDDDGTPDTIRMGGNILMGGSQTLSEVLAELEGTIAYDHTYEFDATGKHATFTAHLFRGGVDVASQYDPGQFSWWKKTEGASGLVPLGTGYTCTVTVADMGYGGHVVGRFTTTEDAELLTGENALTDSEDEQLTARVERGGSVRVSDLAVATSLYQTDRLLVSGVEGEHLVGMATLAAYLEGAMAGPVRMGTTAEWSADPTLVSEAGVLYVYTDHAVDSTGRPVAGVKVGDGSAYVVDLPFTDEALMEHVLDRTVHVTADERDAWNAKVRAYYAGSDQMVLTTN